MLSSDQWVSVCVSISAILHDLAVCTMKIICVLTVSTYSIHYCFSFPLKAFHCHRHGWHGTILTTHMFTHFTLQTTDPKFPVWLRPSSLRGPGFFWTDPSDGSIRGQFPNSSPPRTSPAFYFPRSFMSLPIVWHLTFDSTWRAGGRGGRCGQSCVPLPAFLSPPRLPALDDPNKRHFILDLNPPPPPSHLAFVPLQHTIPYKDEAHWRRSRCEPDPDDRARFPDSAPSTSSCMMNG